MKLEVLNEQLDLADSPPEEAAQNITGAKIFDVEPHVYKEHKETLEPELAKMERSPASPSVADYAKQSPEHAALVKDDIPKLNWMERFFDGIGKGFDDTAQLDKGNAQAVASELPSISTVVDEGQHIIDTVKKRQGPQQDLTDLTWEKLMSIRKGEKMDPEKEMEWYGLRSSSKSNFGYKDFHREGMFDDLPAEIVSGVVDMPMMLKRNKELAASIIGGSTLLGAGFGATVAGVPTGGALALPGAVAGGAAGLKFGVGSAILASALVDGYKNAAANTYNVLDELPKDGAKYQLNDNDKASLAHGVGLVSGVLQLALDKFMIKKTPFLNKYLGHEITEVATNEAMKAERSALIKIGKVLGESTLVGGTIGNLQEMAAIVGEGIGESYQSGEAGFVNGLTHVANKLTEMKSLERMGKSTVTGAMTTVATVGAMQAAAHGTLGTIDKVNQYRTEKNMLEVLQLQNALEISKLIGNDTKIGKYSPEELRSIKRKMLESSTKTRYVWMDPEKLAELQEKNKNSKDFLKALDPTGVASQNLNLPSKVDAIDVLTIDNPEVTDHIQATPGGPTPLMAAEYVQKLKERDQKIQELRGKLDAHEKSPEERAYKLNLTNEVDDETLTQALGTKETAHAFLDSLDVKESQIKEEAKAQLEAKSKVIGEIKPKDPNEPAFIDIETGEPIPHDEMQKLIEEGTGTKGDIKETEAIIQTQRDMLAFLMHKPQTEAEYIAVAKKMKWSDGWKFHYDSPEDIGKSLWNDHQKVINSTGPWAGVEGSAKYNGVELAPGDGIIEYKQKQSKAGIDYYTERLNKLKAQLEEEQKNPKPRFDDETQQKLEDIQALRERVTALKDALPDDVTAKDTIKQALLYSDIDKMKSKIRETEKAIKESKNEKKTAELTAEKEKLETALRELQPENDVHGEADFMDQSNLKKQLAELMPEKEAEKFLALDLEGRKMIRDHIVESGKLEMNKVIDQVEVIARETQFQMEMDKLVNDPNIDVVEKFRAGAKLELPPKGSPDARITHKKPGHSVYAIDPTKMTDAQKKKYAGDTQLREHKAFVRGGVTPDKAAEMLGLPNGDKLLELLSKTPSREEAANRATNLRAKELRKLSEDSVPLNDTAISKAFAEKAKNELAIMKIMVEKSWAKSSKAIQRIALPVPTYEEIRSQATKAVDQMKVGDLNPKVFEVGERKSQRISVQSWLKGDFAKGAEAKRAAAMNTELQRAAHVAVGEVNQLGRLARQLETPEMKQLFKDAGPLYEKAAQEFLDVYNLNPREKGQSERGSFQKFVKEQVEKGNGNFEIPERLSDIRQSINEMTVEEVRAVRDRLKILIKQAAMKDLLYEKHKAIAERVTLEERVQPIMGEINQFPGGRDPSRAVRAEGSKTVGQRLIQASGDIFAITANAEHLLRKAAGGKFGSNLTEAIISRVKGDGKYSEEGLAGKIRDQKLIAERMKAIIKNFNEKADNGFTARTKRFGMDEWSSMHNDVVKIKEWENNQLLNKGRVNKGNLFMMLMNTGNEGNLDRLARGYGIHPDELQAVLRRELGDHHYEAAQAIWDTFDKFWDRVVELHEDTTGITPEKVDPRIVEGRDGKKYRGGYYPVMTEKDMTYDALRKKNKEAVDALNGDVKKFLTDTYAASDMTKHNHTELRTSNDKPLKLTMTGIDMGLEAVVHDLNLRRPIADAVKVLTHEEVAKGLSETIGLRDYSTVLNSIVHLAQSAKIEKAALFESAKIWERAIRAGEGSIATAYIAYRYGSFVIQGTSSVLAARNLGASGMKHYFHLMGVVADNPGAMEALHKLAGEINHSNKAHEYGIQEGSTVLRDMLPQKSLAKPFAPLNFMREKANSLAFAGLGAVDGAQKTFWSVAAYSQFLAGDAPGWSKEILATMTDKEIDHRAKVYAADLVRLSLTSTDQLDRAPIQKHELLKHFAPFWNDARNNLNGILQAGTQAKWDAQNSYSEAKQGNYRAAGKTALRGATAALASMSTMALIRLWQDTRYGFATPFNTDHDDWMGFGKDALGYFASSPPMLLMGETPIVRDVQFTLETMNDKNKRFKAVVPAAIRPLTDIAQGYYTAKDMMDYYIEWGEMKALKDKDVENMFMMGSHLVGAVPVRGALEAYRAYRDFDPEAKKQALSEMFNDTYEKFHKVIDMLPKNERPPEEVLEKIDDMKFELEPVPEDSSAMSELKSRAIAAIGAFENAGQDMGAENPNSSARGRYQFIKSTWDRIRREAPELGLTENGRRLSGEQQERAMKWFTDHNVEELKKAEIPITEENIYAAHFLGAEDAIKVLKAPSDTKIKTLVKNPEDVIKGNNFSNGMKVRDFKKWLESSISVGKSRVVAALDKEQSGSED